MHVGDMVGRRRRRNSVDCGRYRIGDTPGPIEAHGNVPDSLITKVILRTDLEDVVVAVYRALDAGTGDRLELRLALEEHVDLVACITADRRLARQQRLKHGETRLIGAGHRGQHMPLLVLRIDRCEDIRQLLHVLPGAPNCCRAEPASRYEVVEGLLEAEQIAIRVWNVCQPGTANAAEIGRAVRDDQLRGPVTDKDRRHRRLALGRGVGSTGVSPTAIVRQLAKILGQLAVPAPAAAQVGASEPAIVDAQVPLAFAVAEQIPVGVDRILESGIRNRCEQWLTVGHDQYGGCTRIEYWWWLE